MRRTHSGHTLPEEPATATRLGPVPLHIASRIVCAKRASSLSLDDRLVHLDPSLGISPAVMSINRVLDRPSPICDPSRSEHEVLVS